MLMINLNLPTVKIKFALEFMSISTQFFCMKKHREFLTLLKVSLIILIYYLLRKV
jgi:hypothetical protein